MRRFLALLFLLGSLLQVLGDQSVTLAWNPNPEPDVSGYIVYYGNASRHYPYSTNVGNVTTATVYGLNEGLTYYFAVTATNTSGLESDFSNEVTNAIPADLTNRCPWISVIGDQVRSNLEAAAFGFQVGDVETPASHLVVSASSTNTTLVPLANLQLGGADTNRWVRINPGTNRVGVTLITLIVSDGAKASSTSFLYRLGGLTNPAAVRRND
jgi:hypothetical protein